MFSDNINDPNDALEIQNILDIEAIQLQTGEHDDDSDPYEDDQQFQEHDSYDDFFGNVDINGHDVVSSLSSTSKTIMPKVLTNHITFYEASIKEAFNDITNSETVLNCVGAGSASSASSCKNKNGLLHLSHSINKDISSTFPLRNNVSKEHNVQEHFHGTIHCKPVIPITGLLGISFITMITLMLCKSLMLRLASTCIIERMFLILFLPRRLLAI